MCLWCKLAMYLWCKPHMYLWCKPDMYLWCNACSQNRQTPNSHCINASRTHGYATFNGNSTVAKELADSKFYLTSGNDLINGWIQAPCSQLNNYICAMPLSVFTCYPPPSPPKPPPSPPQPPKPPMPPHGAPTPDDYFYCDACFGSCFRMMPTAKTFAAAALDCVDQGGHLPIYNISGKQVCISLMLVLGSPFVL
jgi:hypothetical protein